LEERCLSSRFGHFEKIPRLKAKVLVRYLEARGLKSSMLTDFLELFKDSRFSYQVWDIWRFLVEYYQIYGLSTKTA
jgi:hypothetical protein